MRGPEVVRATIEPRDLLLDVCGEWRELAECRGMDPELFYPGTGESHAAAKAVCARCPVRGECLEEALARREGFGVWGGVSERARRPLVERRRRAS